jgi:hypothetical protein
LLVSVCVVDFFGFFSFLKNLPTFFADFLQRRERRKANLRRCDTVGKKHRYPHNRSLSSQHHTLPLPLPLLLRHVHRRAPGPGARVHHCMATHCQGAMGLLPHWANSWVSMPNLLWCPLSHLSLPLCVGCRLRTRRAAPSPRANHQQLLSLPCTAPALLSRALLLTMMRRKACSFWPPRSH